MSNTTNIRSFETALDEALARLPSLQCSGREALALALNVVDVAYGTSLAHALSMKDGLRILAPKYVVAKGAGRPKIEDVVSDLNFAWHYYNLRELLYFSYNAPSAVSWDFVDSTVTIRIVDSSIVRQYFSTANRQFLESHELFHAYDGASKIEVLLGSTYPEGTAPASEQLSLLIEQEIDRKLSTYYALLQEDSDIDLGGYSYAEFICIYKQLLGNALIHRYQGNFHHRSGAVHIKLSEYLRPLSEVTSIPVDKCRRILREMTFAPDDAKRNIESSYFAMFELDADDVAFVPSDFLNCDGIVALLRVVALRRPEHFLANVSGPLGQSLVERVASAFSNQGFRVKTNVRLSHLDASLPDIDVLAVSEEKTLGYRIYLCEVKNPLPPVWAKDHLRVLHEDSIPKSFKQLDQVMEFLGTDIGKGFLRSMLPTDGLPVFGQEFLTIMSAMVVTSHNSGMFFGDRNHLIVDFRSLERILSRSDGDVVYVDWATTQLRKIADEYAETIEVSVDIGGLKVEYDGVTIRRLADLPQNKYRSVGLDVAIAQDFVAEGHHPFDCLSDSALPTTSDETSEPSEDRQVSK